MRLQIVFTLFLPFLGKQMQVGQLMLKVAEISALSSDFIDQLNAAAEGLKTHKTESDIHQVRSEGIELINLHENFVVKLQNYYEPIKDVLQRWVHIYQAIKRNPEYGEDELEEIAQKFVNNESVKVFMRLDVTQLQTEWNYLNLTLRLKECKEKLGDLLADRKDEMEVVSIIQAKVDHFANLILQCHVLKDILAEIKTTFDNIAKNADTHNTLRLMQNRHNRVWEDYLDYKPTLADASEILKKASNLIFRNDNDVPISSGGLLDDECVQEAYQIDVDKFQAEWKQMNLVQRARDYLADLKALETPGG